MENLFNMAIVSPDNLFAVYHYIGSPFYAQVDLEPGMIIPLWIGDLSAGNILLLVLFTAF